MKTKHIITEATEDGKLQSFCISTGMINKTVYNPKINVRYVSNSNFLKETLYTTIMSGVAEKYFLFYT